MASSRAEGRAAIRTAHARRTAERRGRARAARAGAESAAPCSIIMRFAANPARAARPQAVGLLTIRRPNRGTQRALCGGAPARPHAPRLAALGHAHDGRTTGATAATGATRARSRRDAAAFRVARGGHVSRAHRRFTASTACAAARRD
ncbi:hypothetical protein BURPS1106B_A1387 [Burkholderia pseudomallei 1106b]|uniref:Uncharacterized protein n=2 Tax=Burkholderia pseudomallei TaxID=28450 RepID=A0A0E1W6E2_BURPE|nr:hypothetical protein BURPS1106A_2152 [Burkholderia pseudomallei 1106a]AFR16067.1 hypothetical protein BPC006_I2197 [Burkholderia pseudomallei BPC006]ARL48854.1 hypothetical protein BOC51_01485 [Burkholderia pseudomallei]EDO92337.1 hypothetical protein BURPSPAST_AA0838 [Burkholderia pseudomallei Pasteur 52237]EEC35336.1 conserved hypothetical protein [Burkholderia pseudomallei 576]EES25507.1 hypothetical protein BURPS1106B_A1387 [Burkholderia pseudomallei 1106b]EET07979.1 hypothetical prote